MKRAVAYIRVSTHEQASSGLSIEAQKARLAAYAEFQGIELTEVVVDAGVSASKPLIQRPGGRRVIDLAKSRKIGHVCALRLDRLFRDVVDCLTVTRAWDTAGCALHLTDFAGQTIDTSTAMGRLLLTFSAAYAEFERNLTSERTIDAMAAKQARGHVYGQIPFGYRRGADGFTLEVDPEEQAIIERVLELRSNGDSMQTIAERLNDEGHQARGKRWYKTTILRILKRHGGHP